MAAIRTFIAVSLASELASGVEEIIRRLQGLQRQGVKWSGRETLHFTLAFLGPVAEDALPRVIDIGRQAAAESEAFALRLGGLGAFPPRGAARVLWLGVARGADEMVRLQERLAAGLRRGGWPAEERPFVPHLTLGRVREGARLERMLLEQDTSGLQAREQTVSSLQVMRSDLSSAGPRYTLLAACPFGGVA